MIIYPILNFVLPLMFSTFMLAGNPQSACAKCINKGEMNVNETSIIETKEQIKQGVVNSELIDKKNSGQAKNSSFSVIKE